MRTTLAARLYPAALGLTSATIAALAYLLAQPAGSARAPAPEPPVPAPQVAPGPAVERLVPDFALALRPAPAPPREPVPDASELAPSPREKELPSLDGTAIGAVVRANGGRVPATGIELRRALDQLGDFAQLPVPFSAVALDSGLARPRVVMTLRPGALADAPADRPNLAGRLFLAANTAADRPAGKPRVASVEFISWNTRRLRFDFGVIEGMGGTPELKFLDGVRCFSCHKNRGPILGVAPWSNTSHDDTVRKATRRELDLEDPNDVKPADPTAKKKSSPEIDGLSLLTPRAMEVDTAVRLAGGMLRDREVFRALNRTPAGRRVFTVTLVALIEPGSLAAADAVIEAAAAQSELSRFGTAAAAVYRSAASSRLVDFDPSGAEIERLRAARPVALSPWGGGNANLVATYDAERAQGRHGMTSAHLPSNPKAFVRPLVPDTFAGAAGASVLARTIGLTEPDRRFLREALASAVATGARLAGRPVHPTALAAEVFSGPSFADVLAGGELPDRDDFKDRFIAGLGGALGRYGYARDFSIPREQYTSGPRRGPAGPEAADAVPTTACLRCHDVRASGRASQFNPVPPLAFDPFDKAGREGWVRNADAGQREAVLGRLLKRVGTDRDMPPADSVEQSLFREKDPGSFAAATAFLEAELRRAKGR